MDSPNSTANISSGTYAGIGASPGRPAAGARPGLECEGHHAVGRAGRQQVHHAALTGTTTDRKASSRSRSEVAITTAMTSPR